VHTVHAKQAASPPQAQDVAVVRVQFPSEQQQQQEEEEE
jgi:hypothetical protein